ncbi:monooxygenase [Aneurinibacillus migulanus]|uniref:Monooxygenase n=1 Tax=Aneurinibacillus migulanus TaxID=47500 RepID=A0A0D1XKL3_ANEMI|nr:monooxygenase [Aneurinibacillus migulanus]KIV54781.1 monooxygenase [Aneurinibacillus migulanus]KON96628.1 monooxygenase [Aneurinibacillus migulanus]MED0895522.1 monooxygenase [Aneurinibacillus migulanus]MED1617922.1 monooxygenase [Aneurinibacillus migulanus]SDJ51083.1 Putative mono-oxygenase ydhR [Aneurinibacillus migulanus]
MYYKLLQIDFPVDGPWREEMTTTYSKLAAHISQTPGLLWKIWTENVETGEAGGIYLFEDEASAQNYLTEHTTRLESFGIQNIRAKIFDVNQQLSEITKFTFIKK